MTGPPTILSVLIARLYAVEQLSIYVNNFVDMSDYQSKKVLLNDSVNK